MRVVAIEVDWAGCPPDIARFAKPGQTFVTVGMAYAVLALQVFEGITMFQVIDDVGKRPAWYPSWLFTVVDSSIPVDWICSVFHSDPTLILGPVFVAGSQAACSSMVALEDEEQLRQFWRRVNGLRAHGCE